MPTYKWAADLALKLDNAAGSLTDITADVQNTSLNNALEVFDVTSIGGSTVERSPGIADVKLPITFFVNTTTDTIFGPIAAARTSKAKTFSYYNGVTYFTGECYFSSVEFSGNAKEIQLGSCELVIDGTVTRTSVAPA